jgi:hypothetical protein
MAIHVPEEQAPLRTTREMLDELDMLLQRMLRVPVDEPGKPTGPTALAAQLTLLEPECEEATEPPVADEADVPPVAALPRAGRRAPMPAAESLEATPLPAPLHVGPPQVTAPQLEQMFRDVRVAATTPPPVWLRPLVWCNDAFDRATLRLGWAGGWLRTGVGRALLGYSGVLLLLFALACALQDWLGWTWSGPALR